MNGNIRKGAPPLLQVIDFATTFDTKRGEVRALQDVTFDLHRGTTLGIVGESGSGKTVLVRSIMNLLRATGARRSGQVLFDGRDVTHLPMAEMRLLWGAQMSMIFQDPMTALHPLHRVGWQITEILRAHVQVSKKEARERAVNLLQALGIPDAHRRLDQYPHELSGGMRQRVVIAIALACDPLLVLADEPTTALDVTVQAQILDLLDRHQRERNMTMALVSHDLAVVGSRTDRVMVMYAGQVVEQGTSREVLQQPRMPYTEALLRSSPRLDSPREERLTVIPGRPPNPRNFPQGCRFAPRCAYAQQRCLVEMPKLTVQGSGRAYRCHFPLGSGAADEALSINLTRGHSATGFPTQSAVAR